MNFCSSPGSTAQNTGVYIGCDEARVGCARCNTSQATDMDLLKLSRPTSESRSEDSGFDWNGLEEICSKKKIQGVLFIFRCCLILFNFLFSYIRPATRSFLQKLLRSSMTANLGSMPRMSSQLCNIHCSKIILSFHFYFHRP